MNLLSLPPKLYHGTTGKLARAVFAGDKVLKPRGEAFHDRWGGVASNPAMVYLTDVYAPLYALNACVEASRNAMGDSHNERKELGIIEIDTSCLDPALFYPDEDFLARTPGVDSIVTDGMKESPCIGRERRKEKGMSKADMGEVVKTYRDSLERYQAFAGLSLESCGCACYKGEIPTEAVTRVSTLGLTTHPHIAQLIMDMSVGPEHYFYLRNQAKAVILT